MSNLLIGLLWLGAFAAVFIYLWATGRWPWKKD
jgi:hypothetical protein